MHRRFPLVALLAALAVALAVPASALALQVHVRVEGPKATIFGKTDPLVEPFLGTLPLSDGTTTSLTEATALGALQTASQEGRFSYLLTAASFGPYVSQIGPAAASGASGWVYKVNGVSPSVGADAFVVKEGDEVLWYHATFTDAGGPPTLDLIRSGRCFRAVLVNDAGKNSGARGVVYVLNGKRVRSASGRLCVSKEWRTLRVTKTGAIRSQVVTRG